ncbi:MAG: hypothetical protein EPN93_05295 [Spirochaetes bacterium]|nr:MAG: hypothetical protein EPN93_05295 [Spirochaetota bacterium]
MTALVLYAAITGQLLAFERAPLYPAVLFPYPVAAADEWTFPHPYNPAYGAFPSGWGFTSFYAKPYMLERLSSGGASLTWKDAAAGFTLDFATFGIPEYREDSAGFSASCRPFSWMGAGVRVRESFLTIHTADYSLSERFTDFDAGLIVVPCTWLTLAFVQDNISSLANRDHVEIAYPSWSAGLSLKPAPGASISWNLTHTRFSSINSLALTANLMRSLSFRAGYSRETSSFAFAATLSLSGLLVSYGAAFHAYLGTTHVVSLTFASGDPGFEHMHYLSPIAHSLEKGSRARINIVTCTPEELGTVPLTSPELAARIVKYRGIIGPVSRKAMVQMGASGRVLDSLLAHVYGLVPDHETGADGEKRARTFFKRTHQEAEATRQAGVRRLFNCLLESEVPAATALRLAEMARGIPREEFLRAVDRMEEISEETREQIKDRCGTLLP